jgi:hypothetical protein
LPCTELADADPKSAKQLWNMVIEVKHARPDLKTYHPQPAVGVNESVTFRHILSSESPDCKGWKCADSFDVDIRYLRHTEVIERLINTVNAIHFSALHRLAKVLQGEGGVNAGTDSVTEGEAACREVAADRWVVHGE